MDWRLKCLAFQLMDRLSFRSSLHRALQQHVTGRYFQDISVSALQTYQFHVDNLAKLPAGATALEFGAGRSLLAALLLSNAGAARVYAYDLNRLATTEQVNDVVRQLRSLGRGDWAEISSLDDLAERYRIQYCAPGDARRTGLPDATVDLIYSTSTLEHIPEEDIAKILAECRRISSPHALMSFVIDYHDHYGSADSRITRFNFYRYNDAQWRKFNPRGHYQNRLRHSDFQRLFSELELESLVDERIVHGWAEADLDQTPICDTFRRYSHDDLVTSSGKFVLQNRPATARDS